MARSKPPRSSGRVKRVGKSAKRSGRTPWHGGTTKRQALSVLGAVLLTVLLLGWLERYIWLGAVARELAPLLMALSAAVSLTFAIQRRFLWTAALGTACIAALVPMWSLLRPVRLTPEQGPLYHVAQATLEGATLDPARVRSLRTRKLDLLAVTGTTVAARRTLDVALPHLPYRLDSLGQDGRGGLWSRLPIHGSSPSSTARVRINKCDVQLVLLSIPSRLDLAANGERARTVSSLSQVDDSARAIWLGALGSRPQASDLAPLLAQQRLRDTRLGHGLLASTPAWLSVLGVSSDHVLVRGWIAVRARTSDDPLGPGAHATQLATLELTSPRCR